MRQRVWRLGFVAVAVTVMAGAGLFGPTTVLAGPPPKTTWFVSLLTGFNTIDCSGGSSGSPFLTIDKAYDCADPGHIISIDGADALHFEYIRTTPLVINKRLKFVGTGPYQPAISGYDGVNHVQVLRNFAGGKGTEIENLAIDGGLAAMGGGIYNAPGAVLTLTGVTVGPNSADFGGGIYNDGKLDGTNVTITGNVATGDNSGPCSIAAGYHSRGGGIYNTGTLSLSDATIQYNTSTSIGCGVGGGIFNIGGTVTLNGSHVNNNRAIGGYDVDNNFVGSGSANGGGITNYGGTMTVDDSTVSNNSLQCTYLGCGAGAGIVNLDKLFVQNNTTVSSNTGVLAPRGGGIYNSNGGATTTLKGPVTIVNNSAYGGLGGGIFNYGTGGSDGQVLFKSGVTTLTGNLPDQCKGPAGVPVVWNYGPGTSAPSNCPF